VLEYFKRLSENMKGLKSLAPVFNNDETGNGIRPEKACRKSAVCSNRPSVSDHHHGVSEATYVFVVAAIFLCCAPEAHVPYNFRGASS
jgi:hypothetical protein